MRSKSFVVVAVASLFACSANVGDGEGYGEGATPEKEQPFTAVDESADAPEDEPPSETVDKIANGSLVTGAGASQQWEGIVQIENSSGGGCTGFFITGQHILSAGHCFGAGAQDVWLRAPTWDGGAWHLLGSHVSIRGTARANDAAVVTLNAPVPWATAARRFRLYTGSTSNNTNLFIYGYGVTQHDFSGGGELRGTPGRATVRIVDQGVGYFKANVHTARSCHGDSGGPALKEGALALAWGIAHSFSEKSGENRGCPTPDHDMTWTKVPNSVDFIESVLGFQCNDFSGDGQTYVRCW